MIKRIDFHSLIHALGATNVTDKSDWQLSMDYATNMVNLRKDGKCVLVPFVNVKEILLDVSQNSTKPTPTKTAISTKKSNKAVAKK